MSNSNQRLLIISSCGKAKRVHSPNQPDCNDLTTKKIRKEIKKKFKQQLIRAGSLYTGPQTFSIAKAINLLKENHEVDYYIISAGFGLVHEDTLLPPYDCTFSGKTKKQIQKMSDNLKIKQNLLSLMKKKYDFVYLALGRTYMMTIGSLSRYKDIGKEIAHFGRHLKDIPKNSRAYDEQIFVQTDLSSQIFKEPIGATIAAKGTILLNYALDLKEKDLTIKQLPFLDWWEEKKNLLKKHQILQHKKMKKNKIIRRRGDELMVSEENQEIIKKQINKNFSKKEIQEIRDACEDLRTIDTKNEESREDYIDEFSDFFPIFEKLTDHCEDIIDELNEKTGDSKTGLRSVYVDEIREHQENMGITSKLINNFKYATIKTIIRWKNNPEELKKKSVYSPRKKRQKKQKKKKAKSIQTTPEITIEVDKKEKKDELWIVRMKLKNKMKYPLQNITMKLLDKDNNKIRIKDVDGYLVETANGEIIIPFLKAPMNDDSTLTIEWRTNSYQPLNEQFTINIEVDSTIEEKRINFEKIIEDTM